MNQQHNIEINARLKLAVDSLRGDMAKISAEINQGLKSIGAPPNLAKSFESQFSTISKSLNQMTEKVHKGFQSTADFTSFQSKLTALESKIEDFKQKFQQIRLNPSQLLPPEVKAKIDGLTSAFEQAERTIKKLGSPETLRALQGQISESSTKVIELENAYKAAFREATRLNENKIDIDKQFKKAKDEASVYAQLLKEVKAEQSKISGGKDGLKNKWEGYHQKVKESTDAIKKLQEQYKGLSKEDKKGSAGQQIAEKIKQLQQERQALDQAAAQGGYRTKEQVDSYGAKRLSDLAQQQRELNREITNNEASQRRLAKASQEAASKLIQQKQVVKETKAAFDEQKASLKQLRDNLANIGIKGTNQALEELRNKFKELGVSVDELKNVKSLEDFRNLLSKINISELQKIEPTLQKLGTSLQDFGLKLGSVKQKTEQATAAQRAFDQRLSDINALKSRIQYFFGLTNSIFLIRRAIGSAITAVKELDAAMTETAVVTNFSVNDMWEKLPEYSRDASALGSATKELYEATTLYYQQGLKGQAVMDVGIETMKMARIAGMEAAEATEAMTAALRGFNMEVNETNAVRINDVYSELAAITAADTEQIATAMTKTASIAANANMEFETTAALLAQIIETTQEAPETAGTAMKTIIARFSEVKELQNRGEKTGEDEEGEEINVNKIDKALKSVGISMDEFFTGAKGLDEVLLELAAKWDTLDFTAQRYIATTAAGSRQQSRFIAMMSDYGRTMELVNAANNSAGSSQRQFEKTLDSLAAKLNQFKNEWDRFTMGIADNEIIKTGISLLTDLLSVINELTKGFSSSSSAVLKLTTAFFGLKIGKNILLKLTSGLVDNFSSIGAQAGNVFYGNFVKTFSSGRGIRQKFSNLFFQNIDTAAMTTQLDNLALGLTSGTIPAGQFNSEIERLGLSVGASKEQIKAATIAMYDGADSQAAMSHLLPKTTTGIKGQTKALNQQTSATVSATMRMISFIATIWAVMEVSKIMTKSANKNIITSEEQVNGFTNILDNINTALERTQTELDGFGETRTNFKNLVKEISSLKKGTIEWGRASLEARQQMQGILEQFPQLREYTKTIDGVITLTDIGWDVYNQQLLEQAQRLYGMQLTAKLGSNRGKSEYSADSAGFKTSNITSTEQSNIEKTTQYSSIAGGAVGAAAGKAIGGIIGTAIAGPVGTFLGSLAGMGIAALGAWLFGSTGKAISTGIASHGFDPNALQEAGRVALTQEGGPFVASNATGEEISAYLENIKNIKNLDFEELEKFIKESPEEFDAFVSSIQETTNELHNLAVALGDQKAEEKGYSGDTAERYASLIQFATESSFGELYAYEQQKIIEDYDIAYDTKNTEYDDKYKELYIEYGVNILGLDSNQINVADSDNIFGEDFSMPTHAEIIQALSMDRANRSIEKYADDTFQIMTQKLSIEDSNLITKLMNSSREGFENQIVSYTYKDYTISEIERLKEMQNYFSGEIDLLEELEKKYGIDLKGNYWIEPLLKTVPEGLGIQVYPQINSFTGLPTSQSTYMTSSAMFLDSSQWLTDLPDTKGIKELRRYMNDYLFEIWKEEEQKYRDTGISTRTVGLYGLNTQYYSELDLGKLKDQDWETFKKDHSYDNSAYIEATEDIFKEAWDYALEKITDKEGYTTEQRWVLRETNIIDDFFESELFGGVGSLEGFREKLAEFPYLMDQNIGTIEVFFDKLKQYSPEVIDISPEDYNKVMESFKAVANQLYENEQTGLINSLVNADWENLGELRGIADMAKEVPGISNEVIEAFDGFISICKETELAIADIDLTQLIDQVSSLNKITDKINKLEDNKTLYLTEEEVQVVLATGNVQADSFVSTMDGFVYVGGTMEELRSTLLDTNSYLLTLQQDALRGKIDTAKRAGVQFDDNGKVIESKEKTGILAYDWQTADQFSITQIGKILSYASQQKGEGEEPFTKGYISNDIIDWFASESKRSDESDEQYYQRFYNSLTDYQKEAINSGFIEIGDAITNAGIYGSQYQSGLTNVQQQTLSLMTGQEMLTAIGTADAQGHIYTAENVDLVLKMLSESEGTDIAGHQLGEEIFAQQGGYSIEEEVRRNEVWEESLRLGRAIALDMARNRKEYDRMTKIFDEQAAVVNKNNRENGTYFEGLSKIKKALEDTYEIKLDEDFMINNALLIERFLAGDESAWEQFHDLMIQEAIETYTEMAKIGDDIFDLSSILNNISPTIGVVTTFDGSGLNAAALGLTEIEGYTVAAEERLAGLQGILSSMGVTFTYTTRPLWTLPDGTTTVGAKPSNAVGPPTMVLDKVSVVNTGSSGYRPSVGGGGGGGSSNKWENPYDEFYNTVEKINEELRTREKLELRYKRLLDRNAATAAKISENLKNQLASLNIELKDREGLLKDRNRQMQDIESEYSNVGKYAWYDEKARQIKIDWKLLEGLNGSTDEELTKRVEEYISKLEEQQKLIEEEEEAIEEINDAVWEIYQQGKDEYFDLEDQIKQAIIAERQEEIDELTKINDSINETNTRLLDAIQQQIDKYRQERDNAETEEEIADKQRRLAYLQQDTSGANALEILKLQKEIDEATEDYTDTLIDQKISELERQNDEAAEQRQHQIDIMQAQLDEYSESAAIWEEVNSLMKDGLDHKNGLIRGSRLEELLKAEAGFEGMSKLKKMDWLDELNKNIAQALAWLSTGAMQSLYGEGKKVTFINADGKKVTGTIDESGNVIVKDSKGNIIGTYAASSFNISSEGNISSSQTAKQAADYGKPPEASNNGGGGNSSGKSESSAVGRLRSLPDYLTKEQTKVLKQGLNDLRADGKLSGFEKLSEDNRYDEKTIKAVKKLQEAIGTYPDGYWGPDTRLKFTKSSLSAYKTGGLADFTGPAWLDGTKSRPEIVLNQQDSRNFIQLRDILGSILKGDTSTTSNTENNRDVVYDIDINVEKLENEVDLDTISNYVERKINEAASYRNNNAINLKR